MSIFQVMIATLWPLHGLISAVLGLIGWKLGLF